MKVAIASDHGGLILREEIKKLMDELGIQYEDFGCDCETSVDYPDYALPVAQKVANGEFDRGILICGTGIGMSIAANKVKGIRCALVHDVFSALMTRQHNDSNIIAMGELQGTSMAAPHVAGACALIKQAHPEWGPEEIKAALMNTAKPITNHNGLLYKTFEQGAGRIEPVKAIKTESLVMPGSLQFGKFQLADRLHQHEAKLTIKNVSQSQKTYYFSIPKNEPGLQWHLPLSFRLEPGEKKVVTISMTVDPKKFNKKVYDGRITINEGSNEINIPYLYVLEEPDYPRVMGFELGIGDKEKTYRYEVYLPGGADEFGIALFDPDTYKFVRFLDWKKGVSQGMMKQELLSKQLPEPGFYLAKVFAKKGGREDMIEVMIEITSESDNLGNGPG